MMAWTAEQTDLALRMRVSLTFALNGRRADASNLDARLRDRLQAELEPLFKVDPGDIQVYREERTEGDPGLVYCEAYWRPQVQTVEFWGWSQDGTQITVQPDQLFEPIVTKQRVWQVNRWDPERRVWICQAKR